MQKCSACKNLQGNNYARNKGQLHQRVQPHYKLQIHIIFMHLFTHLRFWPAEAGNLGRRPAPILSPPPLSGPYNQQLFHHRRLERSQCLQSKPPTVSARRPWLLHQSEAPILALPVPLSWDVQTSPSSCPPTPQVLLHLPRGSTAPHSGWLRSWWLSKGRPSDLQRWTPGGPISGALVQWEGQREPVGLGPGGGLADRDCLCTETGFAEGWRPGASDSRPVGSEPGWWSPSVAHRPRRLQRLPGNRPRAVPGSQSTRRVSWRRSGGRESWGTGLVAPQRCSSRQLTSSKLQSSSTLQYFHPWLQWRAACTWGKEVMLGRHSIWFSPVF